MDRRLLVLSLGMFALGTDSFVVAGVLPEIARSFDVSIGAAGQMTTAYAVTYALLAPVIAALAAGMPRKHLLLAGLAVFVLANLGTAFAPTFGIALATRAIAGLGAAMFSPTATSAASMIVPPERRGFALAVVVAGMTVSTALGSPTGTIIGGLGNWHWTMLFVAALAAISGVGVLTLLSDIPMPPSVTLAKRVAPLADARIGLTLAATLLFFSGAFTLYTYFAVVFDRAIGGSSAWFGALLVLWGAAGTVSNLLAGRLIDKIGAHKVLVAMLVCVMADFVFVPWTGASLWTAVPAVIVWGACGWGVLVPQQYRIVTIAPAIAPIVIGLNNSAIFFGATAAGVIGAAGIRVFGAHALGYVAAAWVAGALSMSVLAAREIRRVSALVAARSTNEARVP
ncbi:MFS transporter [Paraburkholderia solisilvae]|nr:MFS transporter [Paraburkholderia solisilvae]